MQCFLAHTRWIPPAAFDVNPLPSGLKCLPGVVHGNHQHAIGYGNALLHLGALHAARKGEVFQQIILDGRMPAERLVRGALKQHELTVGKGATAHGCIGALHWKQLEKHETSDRLHHHFKPVLVRWRTEQRKHGQRAGPQQLHRGAQKPWIKVGVGIRKEDQFATGVIGANARGVALAGPVGGAR